MVIKWKKRNISIVVLYVAAISFLLTGVFGFAWSGLFSGEFKSCIKTLGNSDFQETDAFKDFISTRFFDFVDMACGDYVDESYYYDNGYYNSETTDTVAADAVEGVMQEAAASDTAEEISFVYSEDWEESVQKKLTSKEKEALADAFHERIQSDKNILYSICYEGNEKYSNMGDVSWEHSSKQKNLPEGYNFALYFDGTKAVIEKDGREIDIYGDGIYREEEDWHLPGYKNYQGKEKWKDAEITILTTKEPVIYPGNNAYSGYWSENDFYYMYQNYVEERDHLRISVGCFSLGLILLGCYLFLQKEKRGIGKQFAKFTGRMWFEWKLLLFLVLPVILCMILSNQNGRYGACIDYAEELGYAGLSVSEYVSEMTRYYIGCLWEQRIGFLAAFWLFYLFVCDLRHNKGSYKKGAFGKLAAVLENRSLSLPVSKRIVKRSYGIIFLTIGQLLFLLLLLMVVLVMGEGISWDYWDDSYNVVEWIEGMIYIALAVAIALMIAEYFWQKKNRQFASDLEKLSRRISVIRDGNYYDEDVAATEDADIRQMAEELEDIRKGLETAVEERTGSERMKVELVANVSHDIKTPLTSIISYIQLLKQEEDLPEHIRDYISILDEKSERLKNMVQDVFAVSKAASGQLHVERKELDLGKLLYQTLADMEETIQNAPVTIKTEIPKEPVLVKSDGGRIYRVFQNLIGNAVKYSLEGSRVYISLEKEGNLAVASVKNTSSQELNQQMDFTERFVRGDISRTDGGSGLGLSIAKSFTEACGGVFRLETIADLFVVTVSFQVLE